MSRSHTAQYDADSSGLMAQDWTFHTGAKAGITEKRWVFFQDGAVMLVNKNSTDVEVLAKYASNGNVAATLNKFGKGIVANTGPHPEADITWCKFGVLPHIGSVNVVCSQLTSWRHRQSAEVHEP